jgi:LysM repeat protein
MKQSLIRLVGVLASGAFVLVLVIGSLILTRVDPMLRAEVPPSATRRLPTATPFPTDAPATATRRPTRTPAPSRTPTPQSPLFERCEAYPAGWVVHEVASGESLQVLAARAGLAVHELRRANCGIAEVAPGDRVYLPKLAVATATPVPTKPPQCVRYRPAGWQTITVRPGETLYTLARRYGTTVSALRRPNCLTGDQIYAGQALYVPGVMVIPPTPIPTQPPTATPLPPSVTPTPLPTSTPTPVPGTPTETPTPSLTPTATRTPTPTGTPTPTEVPSLTPTPSVTPIPSLTSTVTPTPTSSPEPTAEPTATPTPTETPTP